MNTYIDPALLGAPTLVSGLGQWESLMRRGIASARCGNTALAAHLYGQSLHIAENLLSRGHVGLEADDRIAAFVVTHLNLADLYAEQAQLDAAVHYRCRAHEALMAMLRDPDGEPAMQSAACRHCRETHAALMAHLSEHGSDPAILAALRAGCMPFPLHGSSVLVH